MENVAPIQTETPLNEIPDREVESRVQLSDSMGRFMSDTFLAYVRTLNFHWNAEGPLFYSVHQLLETHYKDMADGLDEIAERIRTLGHTPPSTLSTMQYLSRIEEKDEGKSGGRGMISQLIQDHEAVVKSAKTAIELAEGMRDYGSADLITERLKFHEKAIWMLRSMISSASIREGLHS